MLAFSFLVSLSINFQSCFSADHQNASSTNSLSFMLMISQHGNSQNWAHFIPAIQLALDKINTNDSILPEWNLTYGSVVEAECDPDKAVDRFIEQFVSCNTTLDKLFVIGDACSVGTQQLAAIASSRNVFHISPFAASPRLSDSKTYKTFVRLVPPENEIAPGIVAVMNAFDWRHLAIITEEHELFTLTREAILDSIKANGRLSVIHSGSYPQNHNPSKAVDSLLASSGRVVFLNSYSGHGKEVMCQVYRKAKSRIHEYAWIIFGWYPENVWEESFVNRSSNLSYNGSAYNDCTSEELKEMFNRAIIMTRYPRFNRRETEHIVGDITKGKYEEEYYIKCRETVPYGNFCKNTSGDVSGYFLDATHGYDAMWLAARALDTELKRSDFTYFGRSHLPHLTSSLYSHSIKDEFIGASGPVKFHGNGDRVAVLSIYQYAPSPNNQGILVRQFIGSYNETLAIKSFDTVFPDFKPLTHTKETVHLALFVCYSTLAVLGLIFAAICMIFTIAFRNKMIVRLTSPPLSVVSIAGIMLLLLLVVFLGIDEGVTSSEVHNVFCVLNLWIGVVAFTLVYGAVLAKAFRVYYIFKNIKISKEKQTKTVQDWHMFLLIGALVAVDVLFLVVVTAIDQSRLRVVIKETIPTDGSLPTLYYECVSPSNSIWLPILAVYKITEVVLSMIFTFEVRKIKVKGLVDSRMITFSAYIIVLSILVIPVVIILSSQPNVRYGILGALCFVAPILLLCLNFVPKMYSLCKNPSGELDLDLATVTQSMTKKESRRREHSSTGFNLEVPHSMQNNHSSHVNSPMGSTGEL